MGKLVAVNFYHEQWLGMTLPLDQFSVKAVKKGHSEGGRGRW